MLEQAFRTRIAVACTDIDPAGLVYFGSYFYFLARAEDTFFPSMGQPLPELEKEFNIKLLRKEIHCQYIQAARFGDMLLASIWLDEVSKAGITYQFDIRRQGAESPSAVGHVTLVSLSKDDLEEIQIPDELLRVFEGVMSTARCRRAADEFGLESYVK